MNHTHVLRIAEEASIVIEVVHYKTVEAISALWRPVTVHKQRERTNVRVKGSLPLSRRLQLHSGVIRAGKFCVGFALNDQNTIRIQQLELKKGTDKQSKDN